MIKTNLEGGENHPTSRTGNDQCGRCYHILGNTLGLSRSDTIGVPGTLDSIGGFTTVNTSSTFGTYPSGTTSLYTSNSSAAILVLPSGSTVLYAELIWGGTYINGNVNLSSAINNPVSFITPAGDYIQCYS